MSMVFLEVCRMMEVRDDSEGRPHIGWTMGVEVGKRAKSLEPPKECLHVP